MDCEAKVIHPYRNVYDSFDKFSQIFGRLVALVLPRQKRRRFILRVKYILNSFRNSLENKKTRKEFLPIWFLSLSETDFKSDSLLLLLELVR